jgi:hypothetical protein
MTVSLPLATNVRLLQVDLAVSTVHGGRPTALASGRNEFTGGETEQHGYVLASLHILHRRPNYPPH